MDEFDKIFEFARQLENNINPRQKQEEEVMEYLIDALDLNLDVEEGFTRLILKAIMRRYDLFDCEDEPRQE